MRAHGVQEQYDRATAEGDALASELPESQTLFAGRAVALRFGKRWDRLDELARVRLAAHPEDRMALSAHAWAATGKGDTAGARRWYEKLTALRNPHVDDYNMLAWVSLFHDQADEVALAAAQRAVQQTSRKNGSYLHTLATVHAARGELHLAQQVLMEAIEHHPNGAVTDADWLVYARIAQGYRLHDIARAAYARLSRDDSPVSSYRLAARWRATP